MQIKKHAERFSCNYFCLYGLLNSLFNKVIEIKTLFCKFSWRQLSFPINIRNFINSQKNFNFVHHNIIFGKLSFYYIFPLPECNAICMQNFPLREDHPKRAYFFNLRNEVVNSLIKDKKRIQTSSNITSNKSFNDFYFKIFTSILPHCSFKIYFLLYTEYLSWRISSDKDRTKIKEDKNDYYKWN